MKINTIEDARVFVENSGVYDWEWGGIASLDGLARYIYENCNDADPENYSSLVSSYLESAGENPADYGL